MLNRFYNSVFRVRLDWALQFTVCWVWIFVINAAINVAQSPASIQGVVIDAESGLPLTNANVTLTPETRVEFNFLRSSSTRNVYTDSNGLFTLSGVEPGRYLVTPSLQRFVFAQPDSLHYSREPGVWVQVHANENVRNLELKMIQEGVITGTILDPVGRPATTNISVSLGVRNYSAYGELTMQLKSGIVQPKPDDRGEFRIFGISSGDYVVSVSGIGGRVYYPGVTDPDLAKTVHVDAGQELRLTPITFQPKVEKRTEVRLKFAGASTAGSPQVFLKSGSIISATPQLNLQELTILLPQGHQEFLVTIGTSYGRASVDVGPEPMEKLVALSTGIPVHVHVFRQSGSGSSTSFVPTASTFGCLADLEGTSAAFACTARRGDTFLGGGGIPSFGDLGGIGAIPPGHYRLAFTALPVDAYIASATINGRDVLKQGFDLEQESNLEIVLADGNIITGEARDSSDKIIASAVVAIIPDTSDDDPRDTWYLYRSAFTDRDGQFEINGFAPGNYRAYAWRDLNGDAFRNSEFMKAYDGKGTPIKIEKGNAAPIVLHVLD